MIKKAEKLSNIDELGLKSAKLEGQKDPKSDDQICLVLPIQLPKKTTKYLIKFQRSKNQVKNAKICSKMVKSRVK